MKKLLSQGLMVAALLSLSAPGKAVAQYLSPYPSYTPQYPSYTSPYPSNNGQYRLNGQYQSFVSEYPSTTSIVTNPCCGCSPVKPPVLSQRLVVGPIGCNPGTACYPGAEERLPQLRVSACGSTELHLMNPQSSAVSFNVRDLGISYTIPANSERVIYLNPAMVAGLPVGQPITYDISNDAGQRLAYSCLVKEYTAGMLNLNRQFAVREEPRIVQPVKEHFMKHKHHKPVKKRSTIRGYW